MERICSYVCIKFREKWESVRSVIMATNMRPDVKKKIIIYVSQ